MPPRSPHSLLTSLGVRSYASRNSQSLPLIRFRTSHSSRRSYLLSHAHRRTFSSSTIAMTKTTRLTPAEVLRRNDQWAQNQQTNHSDLLAANAKGQEPSILWLGCCDSRVPEGVVCATSPGDMFVHRNIANQFNEQDDSASSALTYGVEALGVDHVIIVGHTSCGGVLASLAGAQGGTLPKNDSLLRYLSPLVNLCSGIVTKFTASLGQNESLSDEQHKAALLKLATEENVKAQVENVVKSKVIQTNWAGKKSAFPGEPKSKVQVHGFIHDVASGKIRDLGITVKPPA